MKSKKGIFAIAFMGVAIISFLIYALFEISKLGIMKPAPLGLHGSFGTSKNYYFYSHALSKDSLVSKLRSKNYQLQLFDDKVAIGSKDFHFKGVFCGKDTINCQLRFYKCNKDTISFQVISISAKPTFDDSTYKLKAKMYYQCIDSLFLNMRLSKSDTLVEL
jgi:hypothetical protein